MVAYVNGTGLNRREISASHSGTADDSSLLACDAVSGPAGQPHGVTYQTPRQAENQELDAEQNT